MFQNNKIAKKNSLKNSLNKRSDITVKLYNRKTKRVEDEIIFQLGAIKFLYINTFGKLIMSLLLKRRFVSKLIGLQKRSPASKRDILPFIKKYNICVDEIEKPLESFNSFNEFFIRTLKNGARKVDYNPKSLISPADSRVLAYDIKNDTVIPVKGINFTIFELLKNRELAAKYIDGKCIIFRLAPVDYHRFCYVDEGLQEGIVPINGKLHSVNMLALASGIKVFQENYREYCVLKTKNYREVVHIDVGAIGIGRIKQHHIDGCNFKKGDEKGYFEFGGSTIILLFERDTIEIDLDIMEHSKRSIESLVEYGSKIGRSIMRK